MKYLQATFATVTLLITSAAFAQQHKLTAAEAQAQASRQTYESYQVQLRTHEAREKVLVTNAVAIALKTQAPELKNLKFTQAVKNGSRNGDQRAYYFSDSAKRTTCRADASPSTLIISDPRTDEPRVPITSYVHVEIHCYDGTSANEVRISSLAVDGLYAGEFDIRNVKTGSLDHYKPVFDNGRIVSYQIQSGAVAYAARSLRALVGSSSSSRSAD